MFLNVKILPHILVGIPLITSNRKLKSKRFSNNNNNNNSNSKKKKVIYWFK